MGTCSQNAETELFSVRKQATENFFKYSNTAAIFGYLYTTQQLPPSHAQRAARVMQMVSSCIIPSNQTTNA